MRRLGALALLIFAGCAGGDDSVLVFAAASTTDVVTAIAEAETANGRPTTVNVAASSVLARQVAEGAPADVFVSADPRWLDWLSARGVGLIERRELARGRLVVVGPADAPDEADVRAAVVGVCRIALGDPSHVPAGRYAQIALERLGLWDEVAPHVVASGDVRAALAAVALGRADRAVVYASDARVSDRVRVLVDIPPEASPPIRFEMALVNGEQGRATFDALAGADEAWQSAGFAPPAP